MKSINQKPWAIWIYLLILAAPITLYWVSMDYGFNLNDEKFHINEREFPHEYEFHNYGENWIPYSNQIYMPLTKTLWATAALDKVRTPQVISDYNPSTFRLINIILHAINGILFFIIILFLSKQVIGSLLATLIFALHPIQIEAVAWVSELRIPLCTFFGFISLFLFLKHNDSEDDSTEEDESIKNFIFSNIFLLLALLSNPFAVIFPFIYIIIGIFHFENRIWDTLKANYPYFILISPFIALSILSNGFGLQFDVPFWAVPLIYLDSFSFYLYKIFVPINFSISYSRLPQELLDSILLYITAGIPLAILGFLIFKRNSLGEFFTGFLIFLVSFLPFFGLLPFFDEFHSTVSDKFVYISMLGIGLTIAVLYGKIKLNFYKHLIAGVLILGIAFSSYIHLPSWKNESTLWGNAIENSNDKYAYPYLKRANYYNDKEIYAYALSDYHDAIKIDSSSSGLHFKRALVYYRIEKFFKSLRDLNIAIKQNPSDYRAYNLRGLINFQLKHFPSALEDYHKVIKLKPSYVAYLNRGRAYSAMGHYDRAIKDYQAALNLNPKFTVAYNSIIKAANKRSTFQKEIQSLTKIDSSQIESL